MDAFSDHLWELWLGLAILLGVLELFSLNLILLMLAAGAVVGMALALVHLPLGLQVVGAVITSVGMLSLVRPNMIRKLHPGPQLRLGHQALVGRQALVVSEVSSQGGQVRIGGELWTARPYDETEVIETGATVDVFEIQGATALVHKVPTLDG
jgi:membrane protein implicated in regulation of membrane protease activity